MGCGQVSVMISFAILSRFAMVKVSKWLSVRLSQELKAIVKSSDGLEADHCTNSLPPPFRVHELTSLEMCNAMMSPWLREAGRLASSICLIPLHHLFDTHNTQRFANHDHLTQHQQKHEFSLKFKGGEISLIGESTPNQRGPCWRLGMLYWNLYIRLVWANSFFDFCTDIRLCIWTWNFLCDLWLPISLRPDTHTDQVPSYMWGEWTLSRTRRSQSIWARLQGCHT